MDIELTSKTKSIVILSPFLIVAVNVVVALVAGSMIGKWAFIPIILIEWCLFMFFILKYGGKDSIKTWLKKPTKNWGWNGLTLVIGLIPLPIFLMHKYLLLDWTIWIPWIVLALINPWIEEFYWRGLLLDFTKGWKSWLAILFTSFTFSLNHAVFGINTELFRGTEVFLSTFVMGIVWALTYKKTNSLRWVIFSHFLVDFLNLSVPSFLDLYKAGW